MPPRVFRANHADPMVAQYTSYQGVDDGIKDFWRAYVQFLHSYKGVKPANFCLIRMDDGTYLTQTAYSCDLDRLKFSHPHKDFIADYQKKHGSAFSHARIRSKMLAIPVQMAWRDGHFMKVGSRIAIKRYGMKSRA